MKLLFYGTHDWANICNRIARALTRSGLADARVFTEHPHPFGYSEDPFRGNRDSLAAWVGEGVDWLISTGDEEHVHFRGGLDSIPHRFVGRMHAGSAYRRDPVANNAIDRAFGARWRFVGADSLRFCDDDLPTHRIDTPAEWWREPGPGRDVALLHCPSNRGNKGTDLLMEAAQICRVTVTLLERVTHERVLTTMGRARVFFDQVHPDIGGYGVSAVEAAAMGCAVISDMRHVPEGSRPPFERAEDLDSLVVALRRASDPKRAQACHRWALDNARPSVVAQRWLNTLDEALR